MSAGENVLPSMGNEYATGEGLGVSGAGAGGLGGEARAKGKGRGRGLVKVVVDEVREWVGETGRLLGLGRGEGARRF